MYKYDIILRMLLIFFIQLIVFEYLEPFKELIDTIFFLFSHIVHYVIFVPDLLCV